MIGNNILKNIAALGLALALAACIQESIEPSDSVLIPLSITGSIEQQHTKATDGGFVSGDALGLFAVNYSEGNTVPGMLSVSGNQADNVKYVFDGKRWDPVRKAYYKDARTNVDLYVYYPYQSSLSDIDRTNFEVAKDQSKASSDGLLSPYEASDFLWGKGENVVPTESNVSVSLSHRMSSVHLILVEGTGFGEGEFDCVSMSAILTGTTRKAQIDFSNGTVTKLGAPQHDGILMCFQEDASFRAIVVPQSINAGSRMFSITLDGISYGFSSDSDVEYKSGKQINVTVKINKKTPSGEYELIPGGVSVSDWLEASTTHGGEARQYYVVNVEKRGTLGETLRAAGKDPGKIRHLKITGEINIADYYFMCTSMDLLESLNLKEAISYSGWVSNHIRLDDVSYKDYIGSLGMPDFISENTAYWIDDEFEGGIPDYAFGHNLWGGHEAKQSLCRFVFPDHVTKIGMCAFEGTSLSGAVIIPDEVTEIGGMAFRGLPITSVAFNDKLQKICQNAFSDCHFLSGQLFLPNSLEIVEHGALSRCNFSGNLILPENLREIGARAFSRCGTFTGGLSIPGSVVFIGEYAFEETRCGGQLDIKELSKDIVIENGAFSGCQFSGELAVPSGIINFLPFGGNQFSKIILPETVTELTSISSPYLIEIEFGNSVRKIAYGAFSGCSSLKSLEFPETLQKIGDKAFRGCNALSKLVFHSEDPPILEGNPFYDVAKDNFSIQVPAKSVRKYQLADGWKDFKRISPYYDFSVSRRLVRALNAAQTKSYLLRCPSGMEWEVSDKPDWVSVTPDKGIGKTTVSVTVDQMEHAIGSRSGTIVFSLKGRDFQFDMEVEQYDYDYADGQVITFQKGDNEHNIDVVFIGEGYDAKDIASEKFRSDTEMAFKSLFEIEPYATYKNYFNVYSLVTLSGESGIETENTIVENKFIHDGRLNVNECFKWVQKAIPEINISQSVIVLLQNEQKYYGETYMYEDGSALAVVSLSPEPFPFDFRGTVQHEAGGHAFGKLGDEYIYHKDFISSCSCRCCEHFVNEFDKSTVYGRFKGLGWFKNLSMSSNPINVPWSHLIFHPRYSNYVDVFEGGLMHSRGMFRSENTSCMNNNIPYFSAISRQAIVERIMDYCGEEFTLEKFVEKDNDSFGTGTKAVPNAIIGGINPPFNLNPESGSITYMGKRPEL